MIRLALNYLRWHYTRAWAELWTIYTDWLWFVGHFFSLPILVRTWIAPWKRLGEAYPAGFDPGGFFSTLLINSLMRLTGFLIRTFLLVIGSTIWLALALLGLCWFPLWLILPLLLLAAFWVALRLIFSSIR